MTNGRAPQGPDPAIAHRGIGEGKALERQVREVREAVVGDLRARQVEAAQRLASQVGKTVVADGRPVEIENFEVERPQPGQRVVSYFGPGQEHLAHGAEDRIVESSEILAPHLGAAQIELPAVQSKIGSERVLPGGSRGAPAREQECQQIRARDSHNLQAIRYKPASSECGTITASVVGALTFPSPSTAKHSMA